MLCDVRRRGGVVDGREKDESSSNHVAFVEPVHPGKKRGEAQRMFECSDPCRYVKRIFEITLQRISNGPCPHIAVFY